MGRPRKQEETEEAGKEAPPQASTNAPHDTWMYQGKEARLFRKGEEIPAGWEDAPEKE